MLKVNKILFVVLLLLSLTSCEFISNTFQYKDSTKLFVEALIKKDYTTCMRESVIAKNTSPDTAKKNLEKFRNIIVSNFGTSLDYTFMSSQKVFSTLKEVSTPQNTTLVFVQFSNKKEFGVLKVLFDDQTKKILNISTLNVKAPIPSFFKFWLFGLLAICVPIFNIYIIREIKKSGLKNKWWKYLTVTFLNIPSVTYHAVNGLSISYLSLQFLFGIGFAYAGYLSSAITVGLPLGGIYWLWKLKSTNQSEEVSLPEEDLILP